MAGTVRYNVEVGSKDWYGAISYDEKFESEIEVADSTSDTALDLGGVTTGALLYMYSDQTVSIDLNDSTETAKQVTANRPLLWHGSFTNVYITNASGSTANVQYGIYGT